ncbi:MAG: 2TM domain-containing protein [Bacteroidota bacterium]
MEYTNHTSTMDDDLRKSAKKKVDAKLAFYTCSLVFSAAAIVLIILSFAIPKIAVWVLIPLPVLAMVLGVLYFSAFGYPGANRDVEDWKEEEIQREMRKLQRRKKTKQANNSAIEQDELTLKELERVEALPREEDFV